MNSLIRLWQIISGLTDSLTRTKELVDLGNARMEQSLGLNEPQLKMLEAPAEPTEKKKAKAA